MQYEVLNTFKVRNRNGESRSVFPGQVVKINPKNVSRLLESRKVRPALPQARTFEEIHAEVTEDVNKKYCNGVIPYIREHCPELYRKIQVIEDTAETIWQSGDTGKIEEFRKLLENWRDLLLEGISIYEK